MARRLSDTLRNLATLWGGRKKAKPRARDAANAPAALPELAAPPELLQATAFAEGDRGVWEWDVSHASQYLTISPDGQTIEWRPQLPQADGKRDRPVWVGAATRARLHSGRFRWDFAIDELAGGQMGIGFMLLWTLGPDWGFFGYLGSSTSAWAYDPSTGDVVSNTRSIQGGLPRIADGPGGVVSVHLDLPRAADGAGWFSTNGVATQPIALPTGSVVMPAASLLKETQRVSLANFQIV